MKDNIRFIREELTKIETLYASVTGQHSSEQLRTKALESKLHEMEERYRSLQAHCDRLTTQLAERQDNNETTASAGKEVAPEYEDMCEKLALLNRLGCYASYNTKTNYGSVKLHRSDLTANWRGTSFEAFFKHALMFAAINYAK